MSKIIVSEANIKNILNRIIKEEWDGGRSEDYENSNFDNNSFQTDPAVTNQPTKWLTVPNSGYDKTIIEFGNNIFEMMDYNIQEAIEYVERYKDEMLYGDQTLSFLKAARDSQGIRESIKKTLKNILKEADYSDTYFSTFSGAVQTARSKAEKAGYVVDEDDWFREINTGSGKPRNGQTFNASIGLIRDGKPQRKALQIQVYNRGGEVGNNYELNSYIN